MYAIQGAGGANFGICASLDAGEWESNADFMTILTKCLAISI